MKKVILKREQCLKLAADGWALERIAKVLGISQRQVIRNVFLMQTEKEPKPRIYKPKKLYV